jgi:hypothetical protein
MIRNPTQFKSIFCPFCHQINHSEHDESGGGGMKYYLLQYAHAAAKKIAPAKMLAPLPM